MTWRRILIVSVGFRDAVGGGRGELWRSEVEIEGFFLGNSGFYLFLKMEVREFIENKEGGEDVYVGGIFYRGVFLIFVLYLFVLVF